MKKAVSFYVDSSLKFVLMAPSFIRDEPSTCREGMGRGGGEFACTNFFPFNIVCRVIFWRQLECSGHWHLPRAGYFLKFTCLAWIVLHILPITFLRRCLHDTRSSFIPVRLHPGSILSIYICLHDTNQNCIPERVIPERLHPGSRIGSKFSFQNEICLHVPPVSCKGGTGSFRYGNKQVDWLGWPADSCFRSVDAFTAFSFQNENVHVNVKHTMRVVLEWNSFRYHVNTTSHEAF